MTSFYRKLANKQKTKQKHFDQQCWNFASGTRIPTTGPLLFWWGSTRDEKNLGASYIFRAEQVPLLLREYCLDTAMNRKETTDQSSSTGIFCDQPHALEYQAVWSEVPVSLASGKGHMSHYEIGRWADFARNVLTPQERAQRWRNTWPALARNAAPRCRFLQKVTATAADGPTLRIGDFELVRGGAPGFSLKTCAGLSGGPTRP